MPIELANIQLQRVHRIKTLEQAALVHHHVPGLEGNMTQNLGRDSVLLQIEGIFYGANAADDLETLRNAYKKREPVDFLADAVGQAYFSQVVLERFEVAQSAEIPEQFSYRLTIAEYVSAQTSPAASQAAVKQAVKQQAQNLMNVAALPDALSMGLIPELTNPVEPLRGAVEQIVTALNAIQAPMKGLTALFSVQLETTSAIPEPAAQPPEPAALEWVKQPPLEELLKVGLPVKNLLSSGASVENLLQAAASLGAPVNRREARGSLPPTAIDSEAFLADEFQLFLLELQQAGASAEALLAAGVSEQALVQSLQALEASSLLEKAVWVAIIPDGIPLDILALQPIEVRDSSGVLLQTVIVDADGQVYLKSFPAGTYTLVFSQLQEDDWNVLPTTLTSEIEGD